MVVSRSLNFILKKMEDETYQVRDAFLGFVAEKLTVPSPVDTSAYVLSHSIATASNRGRGYTSRGKPRGMDAQSARAASLGQLQGDIASLPRSDVPVYINNRSPHAQAVENGGGGWKTPGYYIYKSAKIEANNFLAQAVSQVKGA
jgi:hypothetical protein